MANIKFYLVKQKIDKQGQSPILMQLTFSCARIRKQTGIKAREKHWSEVKQRLKSNLKSEPYNNSIEFNAVLDNYERKARDIFNYALLNEIPLTKEYVENELSNKYKLLNKSRPFFEVFAEFTESYKATKAIRTYMKHNTALNFLKEFEESCKYVLSFEKITLDFFDKFSSYAFSERENFKKPVCSDNYFASLVASLKTFLSWASDRGYHKNETYKKFKAAEKDIDIIWLTLDELRSLYSFSFDDPKLERVRDVYCFGCFTGMRYSDIYSLKSDEVRDSFIHKTIVKTKQKEVLSLNVFALAILDKYRDTPFKPLPKIIEQKFNNLIKECCRKAGITAPFTKTRHSGGKTTSSTLPKCEFITSHTARKTFTTLSNELGMNPKANKSQTGHRRDTNFNKYLNITDTFKSQEMEKTWNQVNFPVKPQTKSN